MAFLGDADLRDKILKVPFIFRGDLKSFPKVISSFFVMYDMCSTNGVEMHNAGLFIDILQFTKRAIEIANVLRDPIHRPIAQRCFSVVTKFRSELLDWVRQGTIRRLSKKMWHATRVEKIIKEALSTFQNLCDHLHISQSSCHFSNYKLSEKVLDSSARETWIAAYKPPKLKPDETIPLYGPLGNFVDAVAVLLEKKRGRKFVDGERRCLMRGLGHPEYDPTSVLEAFAVQRLVEIWCPISRGTEAKFEPAVENMIDNTLHWASQTMQPWWVGTLSRFETSRALQGSIPYSFLCRISYDTGSFEVIWIDDQSHLNEARVYCTPRGFSFSEDGSAFLRSTLASLFHEARMFLARPLSAQVEAELETLENTDLEI